MGVKHRERRSARKELERTLEGKPVSELARRALQIFKPTRRRDAGGLLAPSVAPPDDWGAVGRRPWTRPPISNTQANLARSHSLAPKPEAIARERNRIYLKVGEKLVAYQIPGAVKVGRAIIQPGR